MTSQHRFGHLSNGRVCDCGEDETAMWQVPGTMSMLSTWKSLFPSWTWETKSTRGSLSIGSSWFPEQEPQHRGKVVHSAQSSGQGFRGGGRRRLAQPGGHLCPPPPLAQLGVTGAQGRAGASKPWLTVGKRILHAWRCSWVTRTLTHLLPLQPNEACTVINHTIQMGRHGQED